MTYENYLKLPENIRAYMDYYDGESRNLGNGYIKGLTLEDVIDEISDEYDVYLSIDECISIYNGDNPGRLYKGSKSSLINSELYKEISSKEIIYFADGFFLGKDSKFTRYTVIVFLDEGE